MNRILLLLATLAIVMPTVSCAQTTESHSLPNPLKWEKKSGEVSNLTEWNERRNEISSLIQQHEIGIIPEVKRDQIKARMDNDTLFVTITVGKESLTLSSHIKYPKTGSAPYPLLIGSSRISLPDTLLNPLPLARMNYNERQVNGYSQFRGDTCRTNYGFVRLYPELIDNGAYSMWAWGFQRIIDGLEILGDMTFTQGSADYVSYYTYTLQNVMSDVFITVNGENTKYEVYAICNSGGTLDSPNSIAHPIDPNEKTAIRWFKADGNSSLKIIPNEGCTFDRLYNNSNDKTGDVTANGDGTYTYTLTGDAYISVVFRDNNIIQFADPNVKAICVQHWDSNGDGELSKQEAEAVTTLKTDHGDGTYGDPAFKDNTAITSFDELKYFTGLTSIESGAFNGCTNLKTVVVPEGVETIADEAFKGCTELLTVSLPDGLTKIGNFAFQSAKKLFAIRLPETLTEIETYAFRYCSSLRSVVLPANIQKLGTGAFMLTGLNALNIPAKVTSVGETAVCGSSLLSVSVASGNTNYNSADNCNAIINSSTHELISGSKFAKIPEGVLKIGRYAFAYLTIDELEIPSSVGFIDFAAFTQAQLESIVCKGTTPPELGDSPFAYMLSNCKLTVPRGTRDAYIAAGWTEDIFKGGVVEAEPEPVNFDLNSDSKIDIGDVTKLVNEVLKQSKP